jgi:hypothetical protein
LQVKERENAARGLSEALDGMFSVEQVVVALEKFKDKADEAMDWLMSEDQSDSKKELDALIQEKKDAKAAAAANIEPCTFVASGKNFIMQKYFFCRTCDYSPANGKGACVPCSQTCHKGHDLYGEKEGRFYCDCGSGDPKCQAMHAAKKAQEFTANHGFDCTHPAPARDSDKKDAVSYAERVRLEALEAKDDDALAQLVTLDRANPSFHAAGLNYIPAGCNKVRLTPFDGLFPTWANHWSLPQQPEEILVSFQAKGGCFSLVFSEDQMLKPYKCVGAKFGRDGNYNSLFVGPDCDFRRLDYEYVDTVNDYEWKWFWVLYSRPNSHMRSGRGQSPGENIMVRGNIPQEFTKVIRPRYLAFTAWSRACEIQNVCISDGKDYKLHSKEMPGMN